MTAPRVRDVLTVLVASGATGFFLGMVRHPTWQDALEPAQVLANLVRYPPDNPVYVYSTGVWTLIHQVLAVLLRWGWSEQTLTILVSGMLGMLSLQALAVFVLALSGDMWLAIAASFLLYWSNATDPVLLMAAPTTYGVIGLSSMLLAIALIGAGQTAAGAALLGLGFAVHPAWALWCTTAVVVAILADVKMAPVWARSLWPFFLVGLTASAVSAAMHYLSGGFKVGLHIGRPSPYLATFIAQWDAHRQVVGIRTRAMAHVSLGAGLAALWAWPFRDTIPARVTLMLRTLVIAATLGTVLSLVYRLPPSVVPEVLLALMPSRLLALSALTCTALTIGLADRDRTDPAMQLLVTFLALGLCLAPQRDGLGQSWLAQILTVMAAPLLVLLAHFHRKEIHAFEPPARAVELLRRMALLAAAVLFVITASTGVRDFTKTRDRTFESDDALLTAARRPGLLLTAGGMHLVQLRTRRAVLLDGGALDAVNYVPRAAPEMVRILQRVYGVDFFHPTGALALAHTGALDAETGRDLWEARTPGDWRAIGAEFGVTDVLTPADWSLTLPVIARSTSFVLYSIALIPVAQPPKGSR